METVDAVQRGHRNILFGVLWLVGGTIVTAVSYGSAASAGGGRYVIAWGAIVFGALQAIRGLAQALTDRRSAA